MTARAGATVVLAARTEKRLETHVRHIDLQEVRLDQAIQAQVVIELVGEPAGVKEGGVLSQINREVNVEALPMEVPDRLELDVGELPADAG